MTDRDTQSAAGRRGPAGRAQRGQAMMEFAIVAVMFAILLAGILEFGRAWSAANVLNAATRDGARVAAVTIDANRQAKVTSQVKATAGSYFGSSDVTVQVAASTDAAGQPMVTVTTTGKLNLLFGGAFLSKKIAMTRAVSIRDETLAN